MDGTFNFLSHVLRAKSLQLCLTLFHPMDHSLPGSSVHGILQEYWSGLPQLPPQDLPNPGIKPVSLKPPALAGGFFTTSATLEALSISVLQVLVCSSYFTTRLSNSLYK